jgi:hypothetical protein
LRILQASRKEQEMSPEQYPAIDFEPYKARWRASPRVHGPMADAFRSYVTGVRRPLSSPLLERDPALFHHDPELLQFRDTYLDHCGVFKHHFVSSIPYVFQEDCSLGAALTAYLGAESDARGGAPVALWTIGNSEGVIARTVAHLGGGRIHALNNNETVENALDFHRVRPPTAHFLGAPFCDVTAEYLAGRGGGFPARFTVIHENLSFQMIQDNRREQIAYVAQFLEDDGLFTAIEKCTIPEDPAEYARRETIKNAFKARYFTQPEIEYKRNDLLTFMEQGQVSLACLIEETARWFPHVAIVWNSCNFYTLVASRSAARVQQFCRLFVPPYLPDEYRCLALTAPLGACGLDGIPLSFRPPTAGR